MHDNTILKAGSIAILLSLCGCSAGGGGDSGDSVLIGKWRLAANADCVFDHLAFTRKSQTRHTIAIGIDAAYDTTTDVSYPAPEPGKAFVQSATLDHPTDTYLVTDHDHIRMDNEVCAFERES